MPDKINARFKALKEKLSLLQPIQWVQFSLDCAENVAKFIEKWSADEDEDLAAIVAEALSFVRVNLNQLDSVHPKIEEFIEAINDTMPTGEESSTIVETGALDAGLAVLGVLQCALNPTVDNAARTSQNAIDAYDMKSQIEFGYTADVDHNMRDLEPSAIAEWDRQMEVLSHF